jgi:hypothetical protein
LALAAMQSVATACRSTESATFAVVAAMRATVLPVAVDAVDRALRGFLVTPRRPCTTMRPGYRKSRDGLAFQCLPFPWTPSMFDAMAIGARELSRSLRIAKPATEKPVPELDEKLLQTP